jgi:hypothetical protein
LSLASLAQQNVAELCQQEKSPYRALIVLVGPILFPDGCLHANQFTPRPLLYRRTHTGSYNAVGIDSNAAAAAKWQTEFRFRSAQTREIHGMFVLPLLLPRPHEITRPCVPC